MTMIVSQIFFRSLLTTRVMKNSHILTTTYFNFPQKHRWRNLKSFTTKFRIQSKDRKSNYELRPILVLFLQLRGPSFRFKLC